MFFFHKCTGTKYYSAYNKGEYLVVKDKVAPTQWGRNLDSLKALDVKTLRERVLNKVTKPTLCSASGIGAIFYAKDKWASFFMILCIFLSNILLINSFVKIKLLDVYLLISNIVSVIAFMCISHFTQVTLLYGIYVLFSFLLILIGIEVFTYKRKINST